MVHSKKRAEYFVVVDRNNLFEESSNRKFPDLFNRNINLAAIDTKKFEKDEM